MTTISRAQSELLARKSADALGIEIESIVVVEESADIRESRRNPAADQQGGVIEKEPGQRQDGDADEVLPASRGDDALQGMSQRITALRLLVAVGFVLIAAIPWLDGILGRGVLGLWVRAYTSITFVSLSVAVLLRGRRKVPELQAEPRWNPWGVMALLFMACSGIQFYIVEYTLKGWGTEAVFSPLKYAVLQSIYFTAPLLASVCALVGLMRVNQLGHQRPEARTCELSLACMAIFWVWCACSFYSFASSLQRFQSLTASLNDYAKSTRASHILWPTCQARKMTTVRWWN